MKVDRVVEILVRHFGVDYVCSIGYATYEDEFRLVGVRYADDRKTRPISRPENLYLRVLNEPALRAGLIEALFPEDKVKIRELREKAIHTRASSTGHVVGFATLALLWYALHRSVPSLAKLIGYDLAEWLVVIPLLAGIVGMFLLQQLIQHMILRQHCANYGHDFGFGKYLPQTNKRWCRRCGLRYTSDAPLTSEPHSEA